MAYATTSCGVFMVVSLVVSDVVVDFGFVSY